jgi:hypothetical protein
VKPFNPYEFYTLATVLHPLLELPGGKRNDVLLPVWMAKSSIYNLTVGDPLPLPISKPAATKLWYALDAIVPNDATKWQLDEDLLQWQLANIHSAAKELETVLSAELQGSTVYYVSQQLIYNTGDLIDRAENALGSAVDKVSPEVRKDFNAAGRALAFELATGSGFHTMRATESILRDYHRLVIALPGRKASPQMSVCIAQLRAKGEDPKLMDILDHIRDLHRNTLMHPEAFLTMPEALGLFDIAKSAINAMSARIETLKAASLAPTSTAATATATVATQAKSTTASVGPGSKSKSASLKKNKAHKPISNSPAVNVLAKP